MSAAGAGIFFLGVLTVLGGFASTLLGIWTDGDVGANLLSTGMVLIIGGFLAGAAGWAIWEGA